MSQSLSKLREKSRTTSFPYLVLAVSLLLTIGITYNFHQTAKNKDKIRFNAETDRLETAIENKINLYVALLKGGRAFIEANRAINHQNFSEYVKSLELENNYAGIRGLGYVKTLASDEKANFIEKMKAEGVADFEVFPVDEKENYRIVAYFESSGNRPQKMTGFDISSSREWNEAANRAAATGEAAVSGKISFAQESEQNSANGFLIYLPVYKNADANSRAGDKKIDGFIFSQFRADEFLKQIQNNQADADIAIKIYDGAINDANLLMQTAEINSTSAENTDFYKTEKPLDVRDENWIIQFQSAPDFTAQSSVGWTPFILIISFILSLFLFGMTYWETFARIRLQSTAAELSVLEQQKQRLLENEREARLSAEQANRTKDEFIAVVSHELRTPLNTIGGWANILKSKDLSENTRITAIEKIEKNLRSQTKLVEDLLDYAQIISGTINLESKEFSFSRAFENVFSEVEPSAQEKKIELLKDNQLNGQRVYGDENKIKLVIYNLLNNAVKFTDGGGRIEIFLGENEREIWLRIKDTGKGISREFLPNIFDRFTQADSSITRGSGGLGLGLTISNHIVKLHKGTIEAESEGCGKGSVFTVKIPAHTKSV